MRAKEGDNIKEINYIETQTKDIRESLIAEEKMDEMSVRQPRSELELNVNDVMQHGFKHLDDADNTVKME